MTTRVDIQVPASVLEASRALQAANRERLVERNEEGWTQRDATRLVRKGLEFSGSQISRAAGRRDPWRGAVPEFEPPRFTPVQVRGKRFEVAGAYWRWIDGGTVVVSTADGSASASFADPKISYPRRYQPEIQEEEYALKWFFCLPGGGDRVVIIFGGEARGATITDITVDDSDFIVPMVDINGQSIPGGGSPSTSLDPVPTLREQWTTVADIKFASVRKCAVVSKDTVQIIDWPEQLLEALQKKFAFYNPIQVSISSSLKKVLFGGGDEYIVPGTPNINQTPIYNFPEKRYQYEADVHGAWLFLLQSYGYGQLLDRKSLTVDPAAEFTTFSPSDGYQGRGWGWTPAAFSYIKNYDGEFHGNIVNPLVLNAYNYAYVRNKYFPQDAPSFMLSSGYQPPGATEDLSENYFYFRAPSDSSAAITNTGAFLPGVTLPKQNRGRNRAEPVARSGPFTESFSDLRYTGLVLWQGGEFFGESIPVMAWDWDRPLACLIELQRLGFTAGDLLLTLEETASLVAANPAETGFKF